MTNNGKIIDGRFFINEDWYPGGLAVNINLEEYAYPETSFSFSSFYSKLQDGFTLGFASGNYGSGNFQVGENGKVTVGKYVILNSVNIICNGEITIGDHCMFAWGAVVTDSWIENKTLSASLRKQLLVSLAHSDNRYLEFSKYSNPVVIEDNVWVGFDAVILPGVTLGRGCIVGSRTVITESVPPYAVIAGSPARIVKFLDPDDTEEVKQKALEEYRVLY
jgi:acetyltransferase-like isoleucine patch superfamily enzyme